MSITAGLATLKTASDLIAGVRKALAQQEVKPDEVLGRMIEIQGLISDGRTALINAQEDLLKRTSELADLKDELKRLTDNSHILAQLTVQDDAYFRTMNGDRSGPYCTACWDDTQKLVRLSYRGQDHIATGWMHTYICPLHPKHPIYTTTAPQQRL
jgi:hypothetical protein